MISAERFKANKAIDFDGWAEARLQGITATEVAGAATPAGFRDTLANYDSPEEQIDNPYLEFGRKTEGPVSLWLKDEFGIMPNEWLISAEGNDRHLATPDGINLDHSVISEIKTTGKDFGDKVPIRYRRQVQWQLYVTGAEYCVFAWMLRVETRDGLMVPGWIEPKTMQILPSTDDIQDLIEVADKLWPLKSQRFSIE